MEKPRSLLTGFGPFPGVAENPSGWLAETLAARTRRDWEVHATVLPTEWEAVAALTPRLHGELQPHVMIHFGVSLRATDLRIERSAHNRIARRADARGAKPASAHIAADGAARLDTGLPAATLASHLRAQGHEARVSYSCGRYLCNYLYYRSLDYAHARRRDALFVHVPLTRAQGGNLHEDALLHAAEHTLRYVLETAESTYPAARAVAPAIEVRQ